MLLDIWQCIYIYIYVYILIYTYVLYSTHTYIHTHIYIYIYTYTVVHVYTVYVICIYIYTYIYHVYTRFTSQHVPNIESSWALASDSEPSTLRGIWTATSPTTLDRWRISLSKVSGRNKPAQAQQTCRNCWVEYDWPFDFSLFKHISISCTTAGNCLLWQVLQHTKHCTDWCLCFCYLIRLSAPVARLQQCWCNELSAPWMKWRWVHGSVDRARCWISTNRANLFWSCPLNFNRTNIWHLITLWSYQIDY